MPYIEAGHVVEDYEEPEEEEEEEDAEEKKTLSRKEVSPPSKAICLTLMLLDFFQSNFLKYESSR